MSARPILLSLLLVAALSGCGGSGDLAGVGSGGTGTGPTPDPTPPATAGVGTGGTGTPVPAGGGDPADPIPVVSKSLVSGAITEDAAFVVDGVLLDAGSASVVDALGRPRAVADLQRGRVVEVDAIVDERTATGVAQSIRLISEVAGTIDAIDANRGTFSVLGTPVRVNAETAWSGVAGVAGLARGASVEVWGFRDDTAEMVASRVDVVRSASSRDPVTLRGEVSDATPGSAKIRVAGQLVELAAVRSVPPTVTAGATVQVVGTQAAPGQPVVATAIEVISRAIDRQVVTAHLTGLVSKFSSARSFELAGVPVDASGATWIGGTSATLRRGVRVTASGPVRNGRVIARWVSFVPVPFVQSSTMAPSTTENGTGGAGPATAASPRPGPAGTVAKPGATTPSSSSGVSSAAAASGAKTPASGGAATSSGSAAAGGGPSTGGGTSTGGATSPTGTDVGTGSVAGLLTKRVDGATYVLALPSSDWKVTRVERTSGKTPVFTVEQVRQRNLSMRVHPVRTVRS